MNCHYCKKETAKFVCDKCRNTTYCSVECQKKDFETHKKQCVSFFDTSIFAIKELFVRLVVKLPMQYFVKQLNNSSIETKKKIFTWMQQYDFQKDIILRLYPAFKKNFLYNIQEGEMNDLHEKDPFIPRYDDYRKALDRNITALWKDFVWEFILYFEADFDISTCTLFLPIFYKYIILRKTKMNLFKKIFYSTISIKPLYDIFKQDNEFFNSIKDDEWIYIISFIIWLENRLMYKQVLKTLCNNIKNKEEAKEQFNKLLDSATKVINTKLKEGAENDHIIVLIYNEQIKINIEKKDLLQLCLKQLEK